MKQALAPYSQKDLAIVAVTILIVLAIPLTIFLVQVRTGSRSHAAETIVNEAESGTVTGNVSTHADTTASNGVYIQFDTTGTPQSPTATPTPGQGG